MYDSAAELLAAAEAQGAALWKIALQSEMERGGLTEEAVFHGLDMRYTVMEASANKGLAHALPCTGGLIDGMAARQQSFSESGGLCGGFLNLVMARALSCSETNASMGRICAAPTAGSCGILPAVLLSVAEKLKLQRRKALEALLTASGIGTVIMKNATVSGAEGGCQAECGVAACMAAAAAVQMAGGTNAACLHAGAFALINVMGLVCDPIAGLVEAPCAHRNASQAVNALLSADMALAGSESPVPLDEVIDAMRKVGKALPASLRETAQGGIAATPTGRLIAERIFGSKH